ncbi:MAG TPA: class I SAM-dependent methyltransferase [Steroidobacter sp.]|uniref:class I SAM-dependent methyltransferase n=1 Tax=Steroidobacter sp. TaxID=1978227 RepID=UPI002ED95543
MSFKDHFSGHANAYAKYRPDYPPELFEYLATLTNSREVALDCATGSGQAAVGLAEHFSLVVASDGSVSQLQNAEQHSKVAYVANLAEQPALRDGTVDLVVAAQAAHWFDHARFYPEVKRVLKQDGALALWTYGLAFVEPTIDAIVRHFYSDVVGGYWPPERRWVETAYRDLPFPMQEVSAPDFELHLQWDLDSLIGYIGTWSAVQRFKRATGQDPLPALRAEIAPCWGSPVEARAVTWPLYLRVGRAH